MRSGSRSRTPAWHRRTSCTSTRTAPRPRSTTGPRRAPSRPRSAMPPRTYLCPPPSRRSGTCSARPARWKRSRRSSRCATVSRPRRSGTRSPRKASTWTTCPARPDPWTSTASPRSVSRTPSASAATTRCSAWRPHEMTIEFVPQVEEKLSPLERLEALCDHGSLTLLRSDVRSRRMGEKARAGDGVIAGAGRVDGRPVFCYAQDPSYLGGSLGEQHADSIVRVLRLAGRAGVPVVGFIESGGARLQEGLEALAGYGRIFRAHVALAGQVPQISVICGPSAGGGSYAPALTDFVVMTGRASMFLTGPAVVREVMGQDIDAE